MTMDDRKRKVLTAIVDIYTAQGEPVGSNLLSRYLDLAVSPATLRNEMAALTRLGLLVQPHTSAGRVPSLDGYRYYIENLMGAGSLHPDDRATIDQMLARLNFDRERLIQGAAEGFSQLSGYTVVATTPYSADGSVAHYEVTQVGRYTAAILGVGQNGEVNTRLANALKPLERGDVAAVAAALNRALTFVPARSITRERVADLLASLGPGAAALSPLVTAAMQLVSGLGLPRVYVEGQEKLLDYPELDDSLRGVIALFGDRALLQRLLAGRSREVQCLWGDEIAGYYLPGLCLMSCGYTGGGGARGTVALAGPARMDYVKLVPLLRYFTQELGRVITTGGKEEA